MLKQNLFFYFVLLLFFSCSQNDKVISEAEKININIQFERLDEDLFKLKSKDDARTFLSSHPDFVKSYLELPYPVQDSQFVKVFYDFYSDPNLHNFYKDAKNKFGDFSAVRSQFEGMFKYVKYFYPDFYVPSVKAAVTGFKYKKDMAISDSSIIVSYDYFLGPEAEFRPPLYDYFLERYQKPYLVPMVGLALSGRFNNSDMEDESMLATMIYYGKAHYFLERVMPELPDSLNIMYSQEQINGINDHIDVVWGHFIEKQLLFKKERMLTEKYCGERPNIVEIGDKCPGRIGRWLGWQIIRSYMKHNPDVSLQELMAEPDAQKIFRMSKYKPAS